MAISLFRQIARNSHSQLFLIATVCLLGGLTSGCATWQKPAVLDESQLRSRAVSQKIRDVRLSASQLSTADSQRIFGEDVNASGIQAIWLEVENPTQDTLWLLRAGTDPDYFSPLEVAWSYHRLLAPKQNAAIDAHFEALDFENPIPAGETRAGIIFTNPHIRVRVLNVDLLAPQKLFSFTLFLSDPDDPPNLERLQIFTRISSRAKQDLSAPAAFHKELSQLACCASDANGLTIGAPINVVLIGHLSDIAAALVRRGYRSDRVDADNEQRVFGRTPDIVLRKTGHKGLPAHWLRGWVAPFLYQGQQVFVGQVGRPVGGRFGLNEGEVPRMHANVDETRNQLIQDLMYSGGLAKMGFIRGAGATTAKSADNPGSLVYRTDGLRAVMFFVTRPLALSDMELLEAEPYIKLHEAGPMPVHFNETSR